MIRVDRFLGRLLTAAVVLTIAGSGPVVSAQNDDEDEEAAPVVVPAPRAVFLNEAQFDQWVFGNAGYGNSRMARDKLDSLLTLLVDDIDRSCALTPVQKKKLLVAGRGDIKRFFDRVAEARTKFDKIRKNQNPFGPILQQEILPLQAPLQAGLFGEESIFSKAIKATLSPEQAARHEEVVRDRRLYRYRAGVELALELLKNSVGFTAEQHERFLKLLAAETRPPKQLGQNAYYALLYQISQVPEEKVKPILDDVQWRLLSRHLAQARAMGMWLKQQGFVPDEGGKPNRLSGARR